MEKSALTRLYKDCKGYKHFADSGKSAHQYVAERKLGWPLKLGKRVHHKNRDKPDFCYKAKPSRKD